MIPERGCNMACDTVTYAGLLLVFGLVFAVADPIVLNPQADRLLEKMQGIIEENTDSWLPLPTIKLNASDSGYTATVVPFANIPVAGFSRVADAKTNETPTEIYLIIPFSISTLNAEYDVYSWEKEDGVCNFTVQMMSEDNSHFTLTILLNMAGNVCTGEVADFEVDTYWGMSLMTDPIFCGDQVRDQLIRDLTAAHQPGIRAALKKSITNFVNRALEGFSFC